MYMNIHRHALGVSKLYEGTLPRSGGPDEHIYPLVVNNTLMMNTIPSDNSTTSYDTTYQSLSFGEWLDNEAPTCSDGPLSNPILDFGEFNAPSFEPPPQDPFRNVRPVMQPHPLNDWPQSLGGQGATPYLPQQTAILDAPPQSVVHPAIPLQSAVDGTYTLSTHPPASFPTSSSSALFGSGERAAPSRFSPTQYIPMTSAPAPAPVCSSLTWPMAPISGPSTGAPVPVVRPWDVDASARGRGFASAAAGASMPRTVPRRAVPVDRCLCCMRAHPFVRVHDTIEWVRPDVMKMVVYFNWSLNAEAEAHESWEPRRE
ncbi:hypothetical protein BJV78DRAFT_1154749 [Lactifluus subvellereus]|nr:hypothetical protein BJV78DRAFT_1154749 [Lactifluus subvellereus]